MSARFLKNTFYPGFIRRFPYLLNARTPFYGLSLEFFKRAKQEVVAEFIKDTLSDHIFFESRGTSYSEYMADLVFELGFSLEEFLNLSDDDIILSAEIFLMNTLQIHIFRLST